MCQTCNANFIGQLPDHKRVGYHYISTNDEIDHNLKEQLQEHHFDTSTVTTITGGAYLDINILMSFWKMVLLVN